jgi:hypothetical protein
MEDILALDRCPDSVTGDHGQGHESGAVVRDAELSRLNRAAADIDANGGLGSLE